MSVVRLGKTFVLLVAVGLLLIASGLVNVRISFRDGVAQAIDFPFGKGEEIEPERSNVLETASGCNEARLARAGQRRLGNGLFGHWNLNEHDTIGLVFADHNAVGADCAEAI